MKGTEMSNRKATHTLNHPGGGYSWNNDSLHCVVGVDDDGNEVTGVDYDLVSLQWFVDNKDTIFVDKKTQRKLKKWKPIQNKGYHSSLMKGSAVTQFVIVDLKAVKEGCEFDLKDQTLTPTQKQNLQDTLDWCNKWISEGFLYHLSDGQHRNDFFKRYFYTPKSEGGYIPNYKKTDVVPINALKSKIEPTELNKEFSKLPVEIQEMFLDIPVPLVVIKTPNMGLIMETFTSVNSGTPLNPIDLLTNLWTNVSRWLRGLEENQLINTFFFGNLYKKEADITNRETLKKVLQILCHLAENNGTHPYREGIDKKEIWGDAVSPLTHIDANLLSDIESILEDMAEGLAHDYNPTTDNIYMLSEMNPRTCSMLMTILSYKISKRDLDIFFTNLKGYKLELEDKKAWIEWLCDAINELANSEQYSYLDDNNRETMIPQKDAKGNPRYLCDENDEPKIYDGGFYTKLLRGRSLKNNLQYLIDKLVQRFESDIDTILGKRIYKKLSNQRSMGARKKINKFYGTKQRSNLTGNSIPQKDVLNGNKVHATHNIGDAYADGGEEMELGEAELNKKMGAI